MTEGVMVIIAAIRKEKAEWIVVGSVERATMSVVYDAMIIGGNGGKSGSLGGGGWGEEGW